MTDFRHSPNHLDLGGKISQLDRGDFAGAMERMMRILYETPIDTLGMLLRLRGVPGLRGYAAREAEKATRRGALNGLLTEGLEATEAKLKASGTSLDEAVNSAGMMLVTRFGLAGRAEDQSDESLGSEIDRSHKGLMELGKFDVAREDGTPGRKAKLPSTSSGGEEGTP